MNESVECAKPEKSDYQKGIQEFVIDIIRESEKIPGKRYITQHEIVDIVKMYRPELTEPSRQVKQAVYHLSRDKKIRDKRIEPVLSCSGRRLGWKIVNEDEIYKKEK